MNDYEGLERLLRSAFPILADRAPSRDLWPQVLDRGRIATKWSWIDLSMAVAVVVTLLIFPEWLWFLAFHLGWRASCDRIPTCAPTWLASSCPRYSCW